MLDRREIISGSWRFVRSSSVSETEYPFSSWAISSSENSPSLTCKCQTYLTYVEVSENFADLGLWDETSHSLTTVKLVVVVDSVLHNTL